MDDKIDGMMVPQMPEDTVELGQQSMKAIADMTRQNMDMMLAVAQVATQSFQSVVSDVADFSRQSVERTSVAARAMKTVTSPAELMQMQAEFANSQFEAARAEISKYSEMMMKSTRDHLAAREREMQIETPRARQSKKDG